MHCDYTHVYDVRVLSNTYSSLPDLMCGHVDIVCVEKVDKLPKIIPIFQ